MNPATRRPLRRLVVVLAAALASLTFLAAPSGAEELGPRAELSGPGAKPPAFGVDVPGAPVRCDVGYGNDVTISGGSLNVTWAVACRWTDDGQLSSEVADISVQVAIRKNGRFILPTRTCAPDPRPSTTCSHSVPFDGTAGRYDSVTLVTVTWNDGFPPIQGQFVSPGFVLA